MRGKVYVLLQGERGEGGDVVGVFSSMKKATDGALSYTISRIESYGNFFVENVSGTLFKGVLKEWQCGCDRLWIERHKIQ